jgi:hypothetical protein
MADFIIPNEGEREFLRSLLLSIADGNTAKVRLYTNDVTPSATSTGSSFTEAVYTTYHAHPLTSFTPPATDDDGRAFSVLNTVEFELPAIPNGTINIYGYYVTLADDADTVYLAKRFPGAPIAYNNASQPIEITLVMRFQDRNDIA